MTNNVQHTLGKSVAAVLSGAWRESPPAHTLAADEIAAVAPLLCSSGSGALGWWKTVGSVQWAVGSQKSVSSEQWAVGSESGFETAHRPLPTAHSLATAHSLLHNAYRRSRLAALVHEQEIKHVLGLLRAVDVEPVLVKGWAMARLYPDRALRPYGDIDLCVRPDQFEKAAAALKCLESVEGHYVDLHSGFDGIGRVRQTSVCRDPTLEASMQSHTTNSSLSDTNSSLSDSWDEISARTQVVFLNESTELDSVRVLCPEDHLRLLCVHLLRSGAWRPLWLCDVALLLEQVSGSTMDNLKLETRNLKPDFDWDICLGRNRTQANWVAVTIGLAHQLLGAELPPGIEDTPDAARVRNLPRWLVPAVLRQWGMERYPAPVPSPKTKDQSFLTVPGLRALDFGLWTDLFRRWDNPVRATAAVGGEFNNWPRLPYRLRESVMRSRELPKALAPLLRQFALRKRLVYSAQSPRSGAIA